MTWTIDALSRVGFEQEAIKAFVRKLIEGVLQRAEGGTRGAEVFREWALPRRRYIAGSSCTAG
jgi:hypothetical protein